MKSDRELLELAAKAISIHPIAFASNGDVIHRLPGGGPESCLATAWNPLKDDGDALRLAVKCGIAIQLHPAWVYARAVIPADHLKWMEITEGWGISKDAMPSTRRAIVRAAAAIGEAMQ